MSTVGRVDQTVRPVMARIMLIRDHALSSNWPRAMRATRFRVHRKAQPQNGPGTPRLTGCGNKVVVGGGEREHPADAVGAAMPDLAQATCGLDPAQAFLDALAEPLADRVAGI